MAATTSLSAYDIWVSLMHIQPEIWRLIRVPADIRMDRLHDVLQVAFGWTDSHLHQFHVIDAKGGTKAYIGRPDPDFAGTTPTQDETKSLLKNFLTNPGDRIGYEYDFGDGWLHEINWRRSTSSQPSYPPPFAWMGRGRARRKMRRAPRLTRPRRLRQTQDAPKKTCWNGWATTIRQRSILRSSTNAGPQTGLGRPAESASYLVRGKRLTTVR